MEPQQEMEWNEAQKIPISVDLEVVAKKQLQFLATVDKNRHLYDGPALDRAIYRWTFYEVFLVFDEDRVLSKNNFLFYFFFIKKSELKPKIL